MMPSASLRWKTVEALRNSPKGKITYNQRGGERGELALGSKVTV